MNYTSDHIFRFFLFLLLFAYFGQAMQAQPTEANNTSLNVGKGLSGLKARKFYIDENSQIWIETEIGLDVWDGSSFKHVFPPNFPVIHNPRHPGIISNFGEDPSYIYICYVNNQQTYDIYDKKKKQFASRELPRVHLKDKKIIAKSDLQQRPWLLTTNDSISIIKELSKNHEVRIIHPSNFKKVIDFTFCPKGIWLMDEDYRTAYYNEEVGLKVFLPPVLDHPIDVLQASHAFICDHQGTLWYSIPGYAGLFQMKLDEAEPERVPNIPEDELVVNCWIDKKDRKLIGLSQENHVVRHYKIAEQDEEFKTWDFLAKQSVIPTDIISDDFYERIHYGTHQGLEIIKFYVPFLHKDLVVPADVPIHYGNIITSIYEIDDKRVIVSNEDRFSYMFDRTAKRSDPAEDNFYQSIGQFPVYCPSNNSIQSIFRSNELNKTTLVSLDISSKKTLQLTIPFFITDILHIPDSFLLISGEVDGSSNYYTYNIFTSKITPLLSLSNSSYAQSNVNYTYFEPDLQKIYFCTYDNGLLESDWTGFPDYLGPMQPMGMAELPDSNVISINKNHLGNLLVGTYYGLFIIDPQSKKLVQHITTGNGLSNNIIASTQEDSRGFYWVSTFFGLNVIDPTDYRIGRFFHQDGLPAHEFNRNASLKDSEELIFFGSGNGVVIVDPEVFHTSKSSFQILFGQAVLTTKNDTIVTDQQTSETFSVPEQDLESIDIYIGNNDWGLTEDVTYYYKVHGLDANWRSTRESPIRILRLPDGKFDIELKALSRYGNWSDNSIHLAVDIYVPFFNRLWVRATLIFLFLLTVSILVFVLDRSRLKQRFKFQKRVSNLELSLLQSQMNPHFIFNALGAIQFYIFNKEKDIAESYLSKFAGLMRMFLESSRNKFISLKDEVRLLEAYIELEHLRFPDKFESSVTSDIKDDGRTFKLPSMLLQPFIENAINHGIFHSSTKGMLNVHFYNQGRKLYCVIDDNGVGRKEAKKIRMSSIQNHKSRSTQITEERIEILKKAENMHIDITYYDYNMEKDGRSGTRVTIMIPVASSW